MRKAILVGILSVAAATPIKGQVTPYACPAAYPSPVEAQIWAPNYGNPLALRYTYIRPMHIQPTYSGTWQATYNADRADDVIENGVRWMFNHIVWDARCGTTYQGTRYVLSVYGRAVARNHAAASTDALPGCEPEAMDWGDSEEWCENGGGVGHNSSCGREEICFDILIDGQWHPIGCAEVTVCGDIGDLGP